MRPSRCSAFLIACSAALAAPRLLAQQQSVGTPEGAAFLLLPVGARATALGQAAVADGGTTEALFWNPAGLAEMRRTELALHHYASFFGAGDAFVVGVPASGLGTFALAAYIVDYGEIPTEPIGGGPEIGSTIARNIALEAAYATTIGAGVSAGIAYKLVQFRVDCSGDCTTVPAGVGTTHALDVGVRFALPGNLPIIVGASVRNIGFKLQVNNQAQADPLPTRAQAGVEWWVLRPSAGSDAFDVKVLADLQGSVGEGTPKPATLLGLDTGVRDALRVRAGYAFVDSEQRGPSLGLGLKVGRLGIDLAKTFYPADAIGETDPFHVSLRLVF